MVNPFFKQLTKGSKVKVDPTELLKKKFGKLVKEDELPLEAPVTPVTKKEVVKEPPTIKPETETAFEMDTVKAAGVTEEDILNIRETFIETHEKELYDEAVTLCHLHHLRLHSIYGKRPKLITAMKQKRWVEKQRVKHGMV